MACFLAPLVAAGIVTVVQRLAKTAGKKLELGILSTILWGGSILLTIEHAWHGEIVPYPPFLTAMYSPADLVTALHEISTAGVSMVLASLGMWGGILSFNKLLDHRKSSRLLKTFSVS
ncbi:MAG: hypothetical protein QW290_06455 [Sulfolobales archaeon]